MRYLIIILLFTSCSVIKKHKTKEVTKVDSISTREKDSVFVEKLREFERLLRDTTITVKDSSGKETKVELEFEENGDTGISVITIKDKEIKSNKPIKKATITTKKSKSKVTEKKGITDTQKETEKIDSAHVAVKETTKIKKETKNIETDKKAWRTPLFLTIGIAALAALGIYAYRKFKHKNNTT